MEVGNDLKRQSEECMKVSLRTGDVFCLLQRIFYIDQIASRFMRNVNPPLLNILLFLRHYSALFANNCFQCYSSTFSGKKEYIETTYTS